VPWGTRVSASTVSDLKHKIYGKIDVWDLACFVAEDGVADGADLHFVVVAGADRGEKAGSIGPCYVENRRAVDLDARISSLYPV